MLLMGRQLKAIPRQVRYAINLYVNVQVWLESSCHDRNVSPAKTITVRDAAARLGVTPRTLKYYEELGIVVPVRSEGGYRLYEQADLDKLARVLRMRSLGFSLRSSRPCCSSRWKRRPKAAGRGCRTPR
jgi:hypothetical protein